MWAYRLLWALAGPLILLVLLWRVVRGREGWSDLGQRLGFVPAVEGAIWIHGASNGELTSARPLIEAIRARWPETPLAISANTVTGRDLVVGWRLRGVTASLAPLDLGWSTRRALRRWRPRAFITLENEIWPTRLDLLGAPVLWVSARMSEASARFWTRFPGLVKRAFAKLSYLAPQDAQSCNRFLSLGLPKHVLGPVYQPKAAVALPDADPEQLCVLQGAFRRADTLLAASTHAGEDEIILDALQQSCSGLRLILVPRHPRRAKAIRILAEARGLPVAQRSLGEPPVQRVYLADTMGEMALWYRLAGMCFVGGSLVATGGHTPFEPASYGCAILHGPHIANFGEVYAQLGRVGGAIRVEDAPGLADALVLLSAAEARRKRTEAASAWVTAEALSRADHMLILKALDLALQS